jgi:hypothetical protein
MDAERPSWVPRRSVGTRNERRFELWNRREIEHPDLVPTRSMVTRQDTSEPPAWTIRGSIMSGIRGLFVVCVATLLLTASNHATAEITVKFEELDQYVKYRMKVSDGTRATWSIEGPEHWAYVLPHQRMIISGSGYNGIIRARSYSGRLIWSVDTEFPHELDSYVNAKICSGTLMVLGRGPTFGISLRFIESYRDFLERHVINAYDVRSGHLLWRTREYNMGWPIWIGWNRVVTQTSDVSANAIRRFYKHKRRLHGHIEIWSVKPRSLMWRKAIPGELPGLVRSTPVGTTQMRLYFRPERSPSPDDDSYRRLLYGYAITVPIATNRRITRAQVPRLVTGGVDKSIY